MLFHTRKMTAVSAAITLCLSSFLHAYDEVKLDKIIPLVDKKLTPSVLHLDMHGQMWLLNEANSSLTRIANDGKATSVLMPGKKPSSLFKEPVDFGFMPDNSLVVVDPGLSRVAVIGTESKTDTGTAKDWKSAKVISSFPLNGGTAVAVSHDGVIAVGYDGQASIDIFSSDGILLHRLFPSEKFPFKKITALAYANNGTLWALEDGKSALHRFSAERKWMGATEGFENGRGVAVDEFGFAYVSLASGRWKEVSPDGTPSGMFGTKGRNPGEMLNPSGLALSDAEHVVLAEAGNQRLQSFHVLNKLKKTPVFRDPAAYLSSRLLSKWEDQVDTGLISATGDILLLKSAKNIFEWVDPLQGVTKDTWKKKGKGNTGFVNPSNLTLDKAGKIWVSDTGDHSLKQLSEKGEIEKTLGQKGKKEGGLKGPTYLSVRADGSMVVADKGNSRVQVLSSKGLFLFQVGSEGHKEGQFSSLAGLGSNDDLIALLDGGRKALLFFDSSGKFVSEIANKEGKAPFWNDVVDLAVDPDGRFYVLDNGAHRVRIFNRKGQFLADFSATGRRILCGPDNKVAIIDVKTVSVYCVRFVPRALQNVTAAEVDGDIEISWDKNFEATQYAVYKSTITGNYTLVTKVEQGPFTDRDTTPGVLYTYAVVGVNPVGNEGAWAASKPLKAPKRKDVSLVSIEKIDLKPVFTAACKYYVTNPIGEITVRNNDNKEFRNIKLALALKKYSDFATEIIVPDLAAGENKVIPVTMTFNDKIFELTEDTPVQMEVHLSYFEDNQEKGVTQNAPITLYSRNTTAWNEKGRISSFITPKDPPVVDFSRTAIRENIALLKGATVTRPVAKAALFYEALNALGISYVQDPKTPFSEVSTNPTVLDYVQFPRETLQRKTGDCDDTTALMAALLESVGVTVALVDMPGHILLMANTGESDISVIGLPEDRFVKFQGTYWVPIETTRLGQDFLAAWQSGISLINGAKDPSSIQYVPVADVAEKYPPVTLVEVDKDVPAYPSEKARAAFTTVLKKLEAERYDGQLKDIKKKIADNPDNRMLQVQLGMVYVEGGHAEEGKQLFISLLKETEPVEVQSAARNDLGNLAYLNGDYKEAAIHYEKAAALSPNDGGVLINRARTAWRLEDKASAMQFLQQAKNILPEWRDFTTDMPAEYIPK